MPGGRIPPDNRGPQAKGVGKNSKRHDMERQATPGLHGSDLQQGDIQKLEQGQRVAPIRTQPGAAPQRQAGGQARGQPRAPMQTPDAIEFLGGKQGPEFNMPQTGRPVLNEKALSWLPLVRSLVVGPGSSGLLASAFINQTRELRKSNSSPTTIIDLDATDDGLEAMLDELGA